MLYPTLSLPPPFSQSFSSHPLRPEFPGHARNDASVRQNFYLHVICQSAYRKRLLFQAEHVFSTERWDAVYTYAPKNAVNNKSTFFVENHDGNKWNGVFNYDKCVIWFYKPLSGNRGNFICTFRDDSQLPELIAHYMEQVGKHHGKEAHQTKDVTKEIRMWYSFRSATPFLSR